MSLKYLGGTLIILFARKCFDGFVGLSASHVVSESEWSSSSSLLVMSDTSLFSSSALRSLAAALKTRRLSSDDRKLHLVMS